MGLPQLSTISEIASWLVVVPAVMVLTPRFGAVGLASVLVLGSVSSVGAMLGGLAYYRRRPAGPIAAGKVLPHPAPGI
jgi:hypothetical protein